MIRQFGGFPLLLTYYPLMGKINALVILASEDHKNASQTPNVENSKVRDNP